MITDPLFDVRDKVALVPGASSGLGENFARCLALRGAVVVAAARRADRLDALVRDGGAAHAVCLDVTDPSSGRVNSSFTCNFQPEDYTSVYKSSCAVK